MSSTKEVNYNTDGVFNKFDMKAFLSHPIYIKPTSSDKFLYIKEIPSYLKQQSEPQPPKTQEDIINTINQNHFKIHIEDIIIKTRNGYRGKFIDFFTPINFIGQGSFGLVISAKTKEKNETILAVKIIPKVFSLSNSYNASNEASFLRSFDNDRIMKLYDFIETDDYLFLFSEFIQGGSLKDFIIERYIDFNKGKRDYFITDYECSTIVRGILEGIDAMHRNSVMHRDLKPENIMFKKKDDLNSVIIGDFGIAGEIDPGALNDAQCGTLIYMAPEMIEERPYDQFIDLWSCGIIMYTLESGGSHPLFIPDMDNQTYIKVIKAKNPWNFPETFPNLARNLFLKLCKISPFYRYRTNKSLNHPWITRKVDSEIPLTLIETYERDFKIKMFKYMISVSLFFNVLKSVNSRMFIMKNTIIVNNNNQKPNGGMIQNLQMSETIKNKTGRNFFTPKKRRALFESTNDMINQYQNPVKGGIHRNGSISNVNVKILPKIKRVESMKLYNVVNKFNNNNSNNNNNENGNNRIVHANEDTFSQFPKKNDNPIKKKSRANGSFKSYHIPKMPSLNSKKNNTNKK